MLAMVRANFLIVFHVKVLEITNVKSFAIKPKLDFKNMYPLMLHVMILWNKAYLRLPTF